MLTHLKQFAPYQLFNLRILNLTQMLNISRCKLHTKLISTYPVSNLEKNNVNEYKKQLLPSSLGAALGAGALSFISRYWLKQ